MKYVVVLVCSALALLGFGALRLARNGGLPRVSAPTTALEVDDPARELTPATSAERESLASTPPATELDATDDELEPLPRPLSKVELAQLLGPLDLVDERAFDDALAMVTPLGLFERTSDWWDQPDFLALTGDELAMLVPAAEGYAFGGSKTLLDFVGGLPTLGDCERAFDSPGVQRELIRVAMVELPINKLGLTPFGERDESWLADFAALIEKKRAAELDLARELELATDFAHWSILCRAFGAWNQ